MMLRLGLAETSMAKATNLSAHIDSATIRLSTTLIPRPRADKENSHQEVVTLADTAL